MTNTLRFVLFLLAHLLVYSFLFSLLRKKNLPRDQRFLQSYFVGAGLLLAAAGILTYKYLLVLINRLLQNWAVYRIITGLFPQNHFDLGYMLLVLDCSNILYLLLAFLVKCVCRRACRDLVDFPENGMGVPFRWVSGRFYELENLDSVEFRLRSGREIVGKWLHTMRLAPLALFALELILVMLELCLDITWIDQAVLAYGTRLVFLLPAMAYALLAEAAYFLQGDLYGEEPVEYQSDGLSFRKLNDYHQLMKILEVRFRGYLLHAEKTVRAIDLPMFLGMTGKQEKLAGGHESELAHIIRMVAGLTERHSSTYEDAALSLLQRKDVVVFDTLEGLIAPYAVAFCQLRLMQGEKILFLCRSEREEHLLRDKLSETFRAIDRLAPIWKVETSEGFLTDPTADVLCASMQDVAGEGIFIRHREFFRRVGVCVVVCTPDFFAMPDTLRNMFLTHIRGCSPKLQFLFLSEQRSRQTELAVEACLGGRDVSSYACDADPECCGILLWKEERIDENGKKGRPQEELGLVGDADIGMGMSLALAALRNDVNEITVYAPGIPLRAYQENQVMLQEQIAKYLGRQASLTQTVADTAKPIFRSDALRFTIVYDRLNHAARAVELWKSSGGSDYTLLNIISRPYLLREFFADTMQDGRSDLRSGGDFAAIAAMHGGMIHADMVSLLLRMYEQEQGVSSTEAERLLRDVGLMEPGESLWSGLKKLIEALLPGTCDSLTQLNEWFQLQETSTYVDTPAEEGYRNFLRVHLTEKSVCDALHERYDLAVYEIGTAESGYLPFMKADIENYCLPGPKDMHGQRIVVGQQVYELLEIDRERHVHLGRVQDPETGVTYQMREFRLDIRGATIFDGGRCVRELVTGSAERTIFGYTTFHNGVSVLRDSDYSVVGYGEDVLRTAYPVRHILRIVLEPGAETDRPRLYITMAALLNELMKTAFPLNWQDVVVLTPAITGSTVRSEDALSREEQTIWNTLPRMNADAPEGLYIMELTQEEKRVDLLLNDQENWNSIIAVLNSYLEWLDGGGKVSYLRFGRSEDPDFFDMEPVRRLLKEITGKQAADAGANLTADEKARCSFCGEPIIGQGNLIEPGNHARIMCENCSAHAVRQIDEVRKLYTSARALMRKTYSVDGRPIVLPARISVKFKTAKNIARRCGTTGAGRVLGFYNSTTHELWVESGGPAVFTLSTIYHELTHAWQTESRRVKNMHKLRSKHPELLEGHAAYVEIECLRKLGQKKYADHLAEMYRSLSKQDPNDPHGTGFVLFDEKMPFSPFENVFEAMSNGEPMNWRSGGSV